MIREVCKILHILVERQDVPEHIKIPQEKKAVGESGSPFIFRPVNTMEYTLRNPLRK